MLDQIRRWHMNGVIIPKATLGRLPQYLQYLKALSQNERTTISATALAKSLALGDVQVRKDLAAVSGEGRPRVGYVISKLIRDIEQCLGHESKTNAVLVGAGRLGKAILNYEGFEEFGVTITAGFDCDESILRDAPKPILPITELETYCSANQIKLGIITVGKNAAQSICDRLIANGIEAIWNFAPCRLHVPDHILLKQENLALSLAHLNNQISE